MRAELGLSSRGPPKAANSSSQGKGASAPPAGLVTSELPFTQLPIPQCQYQVGLWRFLSTTSADGKGEDSVGSLRGPSYPILPLQD